MRVTGSPGIKDDLVNAGAIWEDAAGRRSTATSSPAASPTICPIFAAAILQVLTAPDRNFLDKAAPGFYYIRVR